MAVQLPAEARDFSVLPSFQTGSGAHPTLLLSVHQGLSDHISSFIFEVKNEWS
jgi:hypothetical protein